MSSHPIVLGTRNPGKLREYQSILGELGYEMVSVDAPEPEETAPDFEGNARLKATAYARYAGALTLAEDAGLVVPVLGGLPGVFSARFADCEVDPSLGKVLSYTPSGRPRPSLDEANRLRLLELLAGHEGEARRAYFQMVIAVADADGTILFTASGEAYGRILYEPRGEGGFGYDALFAGDETDGFTFAEVDAARKNAVSHRRKALEKVHTWLLARQGLLTGHGECHKLAQ
ncbi:MAG: non-canonical purine NTP pyrophosphatase [Myxococcales bacterium]|nr:non-canonical purine NTP pyrophosphatase [Polyangiaceae bacterium]MDW8248043.1 non-canonical purine NTP pyrophosphatase [Myxococcales bacterium]